MRLERLIQHRDKTAPDSGVSRRTFLIAGAAAGGGLLLSLSLPSLVSPGARRAGRQLCARRFHPHRSRRPGHGHRPAGRDGPRDLHLLSDAGGGRTGGRPRPGAGRTGAAKRPALHQPIGGVSGDRRFDLDPRVLRAPPPRRRHGADHADPSRGEPVGCRPQHLPRRERQGDPRGDRAHAHLRRAGRPGGDADAAGGGRAQGSQGLQADRHAGQAARYAREGQRHGGLRHRREGAGHDDRHRRRLPGAGRQVEKRRRQHGVGRQRRAPSRASRRCGLRDCRQYGRRQEGPGRARDRVGRRSERQAHHCRYRRRDGQGVGK